MPKKSIKNSTYGINSTNQRPQLLYGPSAKSWCGCFRCVVTAVFMNALSAFESVVKNLKVSWPSHGTVESPLCLKYYVSQFCFFENPQSVLINQNLKALITHSPWDTPHTHIHTHLQDGVLPESGFSFPCWHPLKSCCVCPLLLRQSH